MPEFKIQTHNTANEFKFLEGIRRNKKALAGYVKAKRVNWEDIDSKACLALAASYLAVL